MGAAEKIEAAKNCFMDVKKNGRNNFQKYNYMELPDINPIVRKVCEKFHLRTKFMMDYGNNFMILTITDNEDKSQEEFHIRIPELVSGDAGKFMQDEGRVRTYAMRYLFIQAFEIAVPDEIDNRDQKSVPKQMTVKKEPVKKEPVKKTKEIPVQPIKEPKTDEVTEQDVKTALDTAYTNIVEKGGEKFTEARAIWQLGRICKNKPQLLSACKNALKMYTADKLGEGK